MDATAHLEALRDELTRRAWNAEVRRTSSRVVLHVSNPNIPALDDKITCDGNVFCWAWGRDIGPVTGVPGVADRIVYVLREVGT